MIRKRNLIAATVTMAVTAIITLSAYHSQNVELEFAMFGGNNWDVAVQDSYVVYDEAIAEFEKLHPNVKVNYVKGIMKEDYSEWLSEKILMDKAPDVMMIQNKDFDKFAQLNIIEKLDNWMERDTSFDCNKIYSTALEAGITDNTQYALPIETVPYIMFVNKTLLATEEIEIPKADYTLKDLYDICKKVTKDTDGDGIVDQFGIFKYSWQDAAAANGAVMFSSNGKKCNFTSEELKKAVAYMITLNELNGSQAVTQENFDAGKVAFMPLTLAEYRTYKTYPYKIKKYSNFQWDCIPMPQGENGKNTSRVDSLDVAMSSRSEHKALAWEFMKFLTTSEEVQRKIFEDTSAASVLKSVMEDDSAETIFTEDMADADRTLHSQMISSVIENGQAEPQFSAYEGAMQLADSEISELIKSDSQSDLESELRRIQQKVTEYISVF